MCLSLPDLYAELAAAEAALRRYHVNVTLSQTVATTATGTKAPRYTFTAQGVGIGAGQVEGEGPTPQSAFNQLESRVKTAYYTRKDAEHANALARRGLTSQAA